jgi:hypothetical protein
MPVRENIIYMLLAYSKHHKWLVKIGRTKNLKNRLSNLQSGCPYKIAPHKAFGTNRPSDDESEILNHLKEFNIRGEWFELDDYHFDWVVDFFTEKEKVFRKEEKGNVR